MKIKLMLLNMVQFFPIAEALGKEEKLILLFCEHIPGESPEILVWYQWVLSNFTTEFLKLYCASDPEFVSV